MGFLDKMVSKAIHNATGYNPRKIVRKVGGGKLLMMGGAALAGALVTERMAKGQSSFGAGSSATGTYRTGQQAGGGHGSASQSVSASAPPPPPPAASPQAAVPPLPPLPGSTQAPTAPPVVPPAAAPPHPAAEPEIPPALELRLVRTMVAAALADGEMDPRERELVHEQLTGGDLSEEEAAQVRRELVVPAGPRELADGVESVEEREALYRAAILVVRADEQVAPSETAWLAALGEALSISEERRSAIETDLFGALQGE